MTTKRVAGVVLALAVVAGLSHLVPTALESSGPLVVVWKGAGVALLAGYAALLARTADGWLVALVMLCGAAGDVLIESTGFIAGAGAFAAGHALAVVLYLRNRRPGRPAGRLVGLVIVVGAAVAIWLVAESTPITVYVTLLIGMAVTAWLSRFPWALTGFGAIMFVISDALIFLRRDVLSGSIAAAVATWGLYFVGQLLIVLGVTRTLGGTAARSTTSASLLDTAAPTRLG